MSPAPAFENSCAQPFAVDSAPSPPGPKGAIRIRQLDVLRAIAVLMVLGRHLPEIPKDLPRFVWMPLAVWRRTGWAGVDLFFVLSGFLIGGLLFRELAATGSLRAGRFLVRRAFKIYPAFYAMVGCVIAVNHFGGVDMPASSIVAELLFVQNYWVGVCGHTWSLAVEEHFYILLPLALLLLVRTDAARHLVSLLLFGILAALAIRVTQVTLWGPQARPFGTHMRIDALAFGVLLAYFAVTRGERLAAFVSRTRWWLLIGGSIAVLAISMMHLEYWFPQAFGFTILYPGFGGLLLVALHTKLPERGLANIVVAAVARIGTFSYSIYLWHLFFPHLLTTGLSPWDRELSFWEFFALYLSLAMLLGIGMAHLVELPVLAIRDRIWPSSMDRRSVPQNSAIRLTVPPEPTITCRS